MSVRTDVHTGANVTEGRPADEVITLQLSHATSSTLARQGGGQLPVAGDEATSTKGSDDRRRATMRGGRRTADERKRTYNERTNLDRT